MPGRIISVVIIIFIAVSSIVFFVFALLIWGLTCFFDRRLAVLHQFTCFWASIYTWLYPMWRFYIEGREKIKRGAVYVVMSNHQSQLDILAHFRLFFHYKFVSKIEIFRVPFIGWNMSLNRYIKLVRGEKDSIEKMMADCEKTMDGGSSVFIYPEGSRSRDGNIKQFKKGAFVLARNKSADILPVIVEGTGNALPKKTMKTWGLHRIYIRVLDPVKNEVFKNMDLEETIAHVRNIMVKGLEQLKIDKEIADVKGISY